LDWFGSKFQRLFKKIVLIENIFSQHDEFKQARYEALTTSNREDLKKYRVLMVLAGRRLRSAQQKLSDIQVFDNLDEKINVLLFLICCLELLFCCIMMFYL